MIETAPIVAAILTYLADHADLLPSARLDLCKRYAAALSAKSSIAPAEVWSSWIDVGGVPGPFHGLLVILAVPSDQIDEVLKHRPARVDLLPSVSNTSCPLWLGELRVKKSGRGDVEEP